MVKCFYLESVDYLSPEPCLYVKSKKRYITISGIVCSILLSFIVLGVFLYYFVNFVKGGGMTIIYSKEEVMENFKMDLNKKLLAFNFVNLGKGFVSPRIASIVPVLWEYKGNVNKVTELAIEECIPNKHFDKSKYQNIIENLNISDFQCLSSNDVDIALKFNRSEWSGSYIILYLRTCTNTTENNNHCYPQEEIENFMKNGSYYFAYLMESIKVNHYNNSNPIILSSYFQQIKLSYSARFDVNVYYSPLEYKTDKGWLIESMKKEKAFKFEESLSTQTVRGLNENYYYTNTFSKFQIGLNYSSKEKYTRTYPKFQSVIANIGGLIQFVFQFFKIIVLMFTNGQYYSSFIDIELNKDNNKFIKITKKDTKAFPSQTKSKEESNNKKKKKVSALSSLKWLLFYSKFRNGHFISRIEKKVKSVLTIEKAFKHFLYYSAPPNNSRMGQLIAEKGNIINNLNQNMSKDGLLCQCQYNISNGDAVNKQSKNTTYTNNYV